MEITDLKQALKDTKYPVVYRRWKRGKAPPLPYIVYLFAKAADLMADNENYQPLSDYQVELYSQDKDLTAEAAVEAALRGLGLPFAKSEHSLETEDMQEVLYQIRIVETEQETVS